MMNISKYDNPTSDSSHPSVSLTLCNKNNFRKIQGSFDPKSVIHFHHVICSQRHRTIPASVILYSMVVDFLFLIIGGLSLLAKFSERFRCYCYLPPSAPLWALIKDGIGLSPIKFIITLSNLGHLSLSSSCTKSS